MPVCASAAGDLLATAASGAATARGVTLEVGSLVRGWLGMSSIEVKGRQNQKTMSGNAVNMHLYPLTPRRVNGVKMYR